jgi:aspartate/methionine/tyrosine aminotransferase
LENRLRQAYNPERFPNTMRPLYLIWTRNTAEWVAQHSDAHNLLNSSIATPHDLLEQHITDAGPLHLLRGGDKNKSSWGSPALRKAIAERYGVDDPGRILVTAGASSAFVLVARALVGAGDHVIVEHPVYEPFVTVLADQGAEISYLARDPANDYAIDINQLRELVRPETRLIVLTNLHNPSGYAISPETMATVAEIARSVGAKVVVDEVFRDLSPHSTEPINITAPDVGITISSLTKAYGLGALRAGWIIAPDDLIPALQEKHVTYECSLTAPAQAIAAIAFGEHYTDYRAHTDAMMAFNYPIAFRAFRKMQVGGLIEGDIAPNVNVAFPRVVGVEDTFAMVRWLRDERGVLVAPGVFFGAPGYIRVCVGGESHRLSAALNALTAGLATYKGMLAI